MQLITEEYWFTQSGYWGEFWCRGGNVKEQKQKGK